MDVGYSKKDYLIGFATQRNLQLRDEPIIESKKTDFELLAFRRDLKLQDVLWKLKSESIKSGENFLDICDNEIFIDFIKNYLK